MKSTETDTGFEATMVIV